MYNKYDGMVKIGETIKRLKRDIRYKMYEISILNKEIRYAKLHKKPFGLKIQHRNRLIAELNELKEMKKRYEVKFSVLGGCYHE